MADWKAEKLKDVVSEIDDGGYVLPVIQRKLVWTEDKMVLLFNSLFRQYSFGSIIAFEEKKNSEPLFSFRKFTLDGNQQESNESKKLDKKHLLIIDGQQRLQTFYIGLCGSINGKELYFDLYSDFQIKEFDFQFSSKNIYSNNSERGERITDLRYKPIEECLWYKVKNLYNLLLNDNEEDSVIADKIIEQYEIKDENKREHIKRNVKSFKERIFSDSSIGISKVFGKSGDVKENRQWMVELFRRLNTSGEKLSTLDLFASKLKSYNFGIEKFFNEILSDEYKFIRFGEDEIIKLLMILQDVPFKDVTDMKEEHANFAVENSGSIIQSVAALKKFLNLTHDYDWFTKNKKTTSPIPLYLLTYYIFYNSKLKAELTMQTKEFDKNNSDFIAMRKWLRFSLLNGVFTNGCGWRPAQKGLRLLHLELSKHKGKNFPIEDLFDICKKNLHLFKARLNNNRNTYLDEFQLGRDYIFYIMYDYKFLNRYEEDHIIAKSLLDGLKKNLDEKQINSIANLELLLPSENKSKGDMKLDDWIKKQSDEYIEYHLIPNDNSLWKPGSFPKFLEARTKLILDKLNKSIE